MMRKVLFLLALVLIGLSALLASGAGFGRLALSLGANRMAATLFTDPAWRGLALFRAGEFEAAAEAFTAAGPEASYNRGLAEAFGGNDAAALEAFDLARFIRDDSDATANFDIIRSFYGGTAIDPDSLIVSPDREGDSMEAEVGQGVGRASGSGDEATNSSAALAMAELLRHGEEPLGVRQIFDDRFVSAGPHWLATLEDVPGEWLRARIADEHERRRKAGIGQEQGESEW